MSRLDWTLEPDENQLSLLPEELGDPEADQPLTRGPIEAAQREAEVAGWIPEGSRSALYISAWRDTRPLAYLRPEALSATDLDPSACPSFFAFVDQSSVASPDGLDLAFDDGRTRIEVREQRALPGWDEGWLSRVRVVSDRFPVRDLALLRVRMENEEFARLALREGWRPEWFIGVCDGCPRSWTPNHCFNETGDEELSIPLRLGVQYWVTDHLSADQTLIGEAWEQPLELGGNDSVPLGNGSRLELLETWRRWPHPGVWIRLYRVLPPTVQSTPEEASLNQS